MPQTFTYEGLPGPNGQPQLLHGDPLEMQQRLIQALGNGCNQIIVEARRRPKKGEPLENPANAAEARLRLIEAVRQVFNLPPIDPVTNQGATFEQCERALEQFLFFWARGSAPTESPPTSSAPAAPGNWPDPAALPETRPTTPTACG